MLFYALILQIFNKVKCLFVPYNIFLKRLQAQRNDKAFNTYPLNDKFPYFCASIKNAYFYLTD